MLKTKYEYLAYIFKQICIPSHAREHHGEVHRLLIVVQQVHMQIYTLYVLLGC
jgi:hypothetical protein